jgi:hypothetical protein
VNKQFALKIAIIMGNAQNPDVSVTLDGLEKTARLGPVLIIVEGMVSVLKEGVNAMLVIVDPTARNK